jgi:hypothetical protein
MDMIDLIRGAQGGGAVQQLGQQFGLEESQVSSAISALVPALAAGFQEQRIEPTGARESTGRVERRSAPAVHR